MRVASGMNVAAGLAAIALVAIALPTSPAFAQMQPNKTEIRGYKGLFSTVIKGELDETRKLLAAGANVNETDAEGRTPLHIAAYRRERDIARVLVKAGANPRAVDSRGYDILTIAAVRDDLEFVRLALELGADPKAIVGTYGGTALHTAAHLGHASIVTALAKAGAPVNLANKAGWTPLIETIVLGEGKPQHLDAVKALLAAGANPNIADRSGVSPLALAQRKGFTAIAEAIAKAGGK